MTRTRGIRATAKSSLTDIAHRERTNERRERKKRKMETWFYLVHYSSFFVCCFCMQQEHQSDAFAMFISCFAFLHLRPFGLVSIFTGKRMTSFVCWRAKCKNIYFLHFRHWHSTSGSKYCYRRRVRCIERWNLRSCVCGSTRRKFSFRIFLLSNFRCVNCESGSGGMAVQMECK